MIVFVHPELGLVCIHRRTFQCGVNDSIRVIDQFATQVLGASVMGLLSF